MEGGDNGGASPSSSAGGRKEELIRYGMVLYFPPTLTQIKGDTRHLRHYCDKFERIVSPHSSIRKC